MIDSNTTRKILNHLTDDAKGELLAVLAFTNLLPREEIYKLTDEFLIDWESWYDQLDF